MSALDLLRRGLASCSRELGGVVGAEILQFEQRADLQDLAAAVLRVGGAALGPLDCFFETAGLPQPVSRR